MKKLDCHIRIGNYIFHHCVDISVSTSIEDLTDTCTIEIPRKVNWQGKTIALGEDGIIRTGNRVTVRLGYDGDLQTVFKGYLKHIKPGVRMKLTCENEMYTLKQGVIKSSYKSIDLNGLLKAILPSGITYRCNDIQLGQIVINNMTPAKILDQLQSDFGIFSYFRDDILYSGLAYWPDVADTHTLRIGYNVVSDDSLEFIREEDVKLKVKAISILKNNTKIEKEVGDPDGEQRTIHFYDVPESSLQAAAEAEMQKLRYTGLSGSLTAFGEPYVQKGDIVEIEDEDYPEKNGAYQVKAVHYNFGTRGYRQKIALGPKI